jgi:hypothetical protein
MARSGTSAPAQLTIPAILNNFPPGTWVFVQTVGLLEGPGRPDPGKPVRSGPFGEKPAVQEEEPHEDRHHQVHTDVMPEAPEDDLALDREHEEHEREDEAVVPVPEGGIIFPERIDPGKKQEQRHESNHDERDKAGARRFSHGAVRLTRGIPVRDHLIGECRVRGERDEMRPAMIASLMRFMPGVGFRWVMKMGEVPEPGFRGGGFGVGIVL